MVKVCTDLGLKSIDCFAHKCNLAIWDGVRKLNDDESTKSLLERIKKFVRKLKKSPVQKEQFENLQKLLELPKLSLTKDTEVRWSSTFQMIDRFLVNRQAINLLCAQDTDLPRFSSDEWTVISALRKILSPIHSATNDLQKRGTPISAMIPLFRVICFALEEGDLKHVKKAITDGLKHRMDAKIDASGNVKRFSWDESRELVLSTILDPRFKLSFLNAEKHDRYKIWLTNEAENVQNIKDLIITEVCETDQIQSQGSSEFHDLFSRCEQNIATECGLDITAQPLPSPETLNNRQKAEVEVNDYLHDKKIPIDSDPYGYWTGDNAVKWPLLTCLAHRFLSAPATSAESERLFSAAGLIINDLRKRLTPENAEILLFLHHNLKIYDFDYS